MVVVMEVEGEELESEVGVGCVEAGLGLFEWEDIILVTFESDVRRSDCIQCRWQSLRDGDAGGFCAGFFFGSWSFEEDPGCKSGDGEGGQDGCSGIDGALGDGCLSVVVASGVRMIVGGGSAGNSGSGYEWWGCLCGWCRS